MSFRFFADDDTPELIPPKPGAQEQTELPRGEAPGKPRRAPQMPE